MTVQVLVESSYVLSVVWPHDSVNSQCMTWSKAGFPKPCFNKIFHISGMIWVSDKECCLKLVGNVCAIKWIARCKEICSACLLSARRLCSSFSTCRSYRKECDRRPMRQKCSVHTPSKKVLWYHYYSEYSKLCFLPLKLNCSLPSSCQLLPHWIPCNSDWRHPSAALLLAREMEVPRLLLSCLHSSLGCGVAGGCFSERRCTVDSWHSCHRC